MTDIKYIVLQTLTGGFYLGAEQAIGHPAECIISYPKFDFCKKLPNGNIKQVANEYHLLEYLKKKNRSVPYYQFNRDPFEDNMDLNVQLLNNGTIIDTPDYSNIDLVVATPVCSGLSNSTICSSDTKNSRNNNMLFLANYTLRVIKPKCYIFENAPTLVGDVGNSVRSQLELIAKETNYSVCYYKTDTALHNNCQRRPRTFVLFFKANGNKKGVPHINFENKPISIDEFLNKIPSDATQQFTMEENPIIRAIIDYMKYNHGINWRDTTNINIVLRYIIKQKELDNLNEFVLNNNSYSKSVKDRVLNYIKHIKDNQDNNKYFWIVSPSITNLNMPAVMYRNIDSALHYSEDRLYTIREWLTAMGMPFDFEMQGYNPKVYYKQIGQNVPVGTAKFIVNEAVNIIKNWDSINRENELNVVYYNNIEQTYNVLHNL